MITESSVYSKYMNSERNKVPEFDNISLMVENDEISEVGNERLSEFREIVARQFMYMNKNIIV